MQAILIGDCPTRMSYPLFWNVAVPALPLTLRCFLEYHTRIPFISGLRRRMPTVRATLGLSISAMAATTGPTATTLGMCG